MAREEFTGPWTLPRVQFKDKQYVVDLRLRQFRDVNKPYHYVDFNTDLGQSMCKQAGVVVCCQCHMGAIVSAALRAEPLRCMHCFSVIE